MRHGTRIAIIGFGEAGQHIGRGLAAGIPGIRAYDIRHGETALSEAARQCGIALCDESARATENADLIFSLVTASSAIDAARTAAKNLKPGQTYIDFNSVSPMTKRAVAEAIARPARNSSKRRSWRRFRDRTKRCRCSCPRREPVKSPGD
jgi:3-hydroxyisobutyrate dehydrogenase-like beta-hydroxyacid dehydrogenase